MSGRIKVMTVSRTLRERVPTHNWYNWLFSDIIPPGSTTLGGGLSTDIIPVYIYLNVSFSVMVPVYILDIYTTQTTLSQRVSEQTQAITSPLRCLDMEQRWQHLDWIRQATVEYSHCFLENVHGFHFGMATVDYGIVKITTPMKDQLQSSVVVPTAWQLVIIISAEITYTHTESLICRKSCSACKSDERWLICVFLDSCCCCCCSSGASVCTGHGYCALARMLTTVH